MKYITLFLAIIFSVSISAQDCTKELLLQKTGTWKESSGGGSGITAADLAKEKKDGLDIYLFGSKEILGKYGLSSVFPVIEYIRQWGYILILMVAIPGHIQICRVMDIRIAAWL